jgi:hypothetical protein|tara:strand:- start:42 stop:758 length:717 start_codon:yes stop_codon:yes gene_type:complete
MGLGLGLGATLGYTPFTLTSVSSLALWLQNGVGVTVGQWDDSSGNNNHATQGTSGNQAAVSGGGLDFEEGETDHYDLASAITIAENQGFCFAIVLNQETDTNNTILSKDTNDVIQISNSEIKIITNDDTFTTTTAAFDNNPFAASAGKMLVLVNRTAGASNVFTFFKNGTQITPNSTPSSGEAEGENPFGFDLNVIGTRPNVVQNFDGIIHELAFWTKGLSTTEIADVNSYLKGIHGL